MSIWLFQLRHLTPCIHVLGAWVLPAVHRPQAPLTWSPFETERVRQVGFAQARYDLLSVWKCQLQVHPQRAFAQEVSA